MPNQPLFKLNKSGQYIPRTKQNRVQWRAVKLALRYGSTSDLDHVDPEFVEYLLRRGVIAQV